MRTPVRGAGAKTGAGLWPAIVGRLLTRQMWIELYGLPGYGLTLKGAKAPGLRLHAARFPPADPAFGKARAVRPAGPWRGPVWTPDAGDDPFNRPSPTRGFAIDLHAFAWLPVLMAQDERGAREALRLTLAWARRFRALVALRLGARDPGAPGLQPVLRRPPDGPGRHRGRAAASDRPLEPSGRQILRPPGGLASLAERLTAAAVAGCALAGKPGASIRRRRCTGPRGALRVAVEADGGHASRTPEAGL